MLTLYCKTCGAHIRSRDDIDYLTVDVPTETQVGTCCDRCLGVGVEQRVDADRKLERRELRAEAK
jgi:hypothetical protein